MAHVSMSFTKEDRIDETITYFPSKLSILNLPLLTTRPKALLRGNCSVKENVKANLGKIATGSVGPLMGNRPKRSKETRATTACGLRPPPAYDGPRSL
jgi:hypothetical protein